jgi:PAS domain-containing protein
MTERARPAVIQPFLTGACNRIAAVRLWPAPSHASCTGTAALTMPSPLELVTDPARLAALRRYDIAGAPAERAFDDITRLACLLFDAPAAAINLIEEDRQFFISEIGIGVREMPLSTSVSMYTLGSPDPLIVADLAADPRYQVRADARFRAYAGVPLITPDGFHLGALCVLDSGPRELASAPIEALSALARQVMTQLELRRTVAAQEESARALRLSEEMFRAAFDDVAVGMVLVDPKGRIQRANRVHASGRPGHRSVAGTRRRAGTAQRSRVRETVRPRRRPRGVGPRPPVTRARRARQALDVRRDGRGRDATAARTRGAAAHAPPAGLRTRRC